MRLKTAPMTLRVTPGLPTSHNRIVVSAPLERTQGRPAQQTATRQGQRTMPQCHNAARTSQRSHSARHNVNLAGPLTRAHGRKREHRSRVCRPLGEPHGGHDCHIPHDDFGVVSPRAQEAAWQGGEGQQPCRVLYTPWYALQIPDLQWTREMCSLNYGKQATHTARQWCTGCGHAANIHMGLTMVPFALSQIRTEMSVDAVAK